MHEARPPCAARPLRDEREPALREGSDPNRWQESGAVWASRSHLVRKMMRQTVRNMGSRKRSLFLALGALLGKKKHGGLNIRRNTH